jgi:hypothetical protein
MNQPRVVITLDRLPSKGKCYPPDAIIEYRGYLFGELQELNNSKGLSLVDIFEKAMSGIHTLRLPKDDITLPDATYLTIARRLSSLGTNDFEVKHKCVSCGTVNSKQFNQMDLDFDDLQIDGKGIELTLSNEKVYYFTPLTYGDFKKLLNNTISSVIKGDLARNPTAIYASMVRNHKFDEAYTDFYNLTNYDDIEDLKKVNTLLGHDLKPLQYDCVKCGTANSIKLEGRDSLITPFRDERHTHRERIRIVTTPKLEPVSHQATGV